MKTYKILIPVLLILASASVVFAVVSNHYTKNIKPAEQVTTNFSLAGSKYSAMLSGSGALDYPLLQTDIDGLFYLANPNGTVVFYEVAPAGLIPYKGTVSTLKTKVTCSGQNIPVKLTYIRQGDKITGFGLFTTAISKAPVKIFEYAFFKITSLPSGYGKSGVLLLVDFDKTHFYLNDKLYTEAFILSPGSGKTANLVTNNARTIDITGAFRSDWIMLNDGFLNSLGGKPYYLSSRDYNLDKKGLISEIITVGGSKPARVVTGALGLWARVTEKGTAYLRGTDNGFKSVLLADKKETVVKEFSGDYFKDYISSGSYVLNKKSLILTDLLTGEDKALKNVEVNDYSVLSVSPNGAWAVIASTGGTGLKASQSISFCSLSAGTVKTVTEPLIFLQTGANFCWLDNNTLLHLRPDSDDGTGISYCIVKMTDILAQ